MSRPRPSTTTPGRTSFACCSPNAAKPGRACCSSAMTRAWRRCSTATCRWPNSIAPPRLSRFEMYLFRLAMASLANRRFTAILTAFAIALSVCLLLAVERVRVEARNSFASTISGTDLIVGARSGSVNLLLYSVFRIGNATNNIRWDSYEHFAANPQVKWAIPISLGDSHRGYRVMGTNESYFEHYQYGRGGWAPNDPFSRHPRAGRNHPLERAGARAFATDPFEVVLGAEVAEAL